MNGVKQKKQEFVIIKYFKKKKMNKIMLVNLVWILFIGVGIVNIVFVINIIKNLFKNLFCAQALKEQTLFDLWVPRNGLKI